MGLRAIIIFGVIIISAFMLQEVFCDESINRENNIQEKKSQPTSSEKAKGSDVLKPALEAQKTDDKIDLDLPIYVDQTLVERELAEKEAADTMQALSESLQKTMTEYIINEASFPTVPQEANLSPIFRAKAEKSSP